MNAIFFDGDMASFGVDRAIMGRIMGLRGELETKNFLII